MRMLLEEEHRKVRALEARVITLDERAGTVSRQKEQPLMDPAAKMPTHGPRTERDAPALVDQHDEAGLMQASSPAVMNGPAGDGGLGGESAANGAGGGGGGGEGMLGESRVVRKVDELGRSMEAFRIEATEQNALLEQVRGLGEFVGVLPYTLHPKP